MSKAVGIRYAEVDRETKETKIHLVLDLDGGTRQDVGTGIAFLDHMLKLAAFHGQFDLGVTAEGDLAVEDHHTVEDVGIVFGMAFKKAVDSAQSIVRYASNHTPMDDALVLVAIDICGRPNLTFECGFNRPNLGELSTENVREFFKAFTSHSGVTLHVHKICGINDHHVCEAIFKAFGRALHDAAMQSDRRITPSTKGVIG